MAGRSLRQPSNHADPRHAQRRVPLSLSAPPRSALLGVENRSRRGCQGRWRLRSLVAGHRHTWPEWVLEKIAITKPMPKRTFDASAIEKFRNTGIEHLIRFVAEAAEGQRNSILFWAACRVGEAVRAGAITASSGTILLEAASSQCRLPLEAARKTINSGISRGLSS